MKRLDFATDRSQAAHGRDAIVRAALAVRVASPRPVGQGITMKTGVPGRGSA